MSKIIKNKKGITLIECLITIFILILGLWGVMQFFPFALNIGKDSENVTIATNLAQAKIEEILSLDYSTISVGIIEAKQRVSTDPNNAFYPYFRQTEVKYVDGNLSESGTDLGLKKIKVTTFWQSPLGRVEKSVDLITLISQK